jgi:Uma2 family endonuclease
MTVQTIVPVPITGTEPRARRWTREEFYRLAEEGFFRGQRAELIEGQIMVQSPQKWPHAAATDRVAELLRNGFGLGFWVRSQLPLDLGPLGEPEPGVSVVTGRREDFRDHPTTAGLVVEVSDATLAYDQTDKASLYARAGIADYWIVNLVADQLEVYRDPVPDATQPHGHRYSTARVYFRNMTIAPLAKPAAALAVSSLLG